jgi:formate hydrogenlyase subunit 6/NADH:ubiquinone oxidoreductase subunit I
VNVPDTHIRIEAEKCLFCGKCEHNCPAHAISIDRRNRTWTIDREKCITCGVCADGCPAHCLTLADAWEAGEKKEMKAAFQGRVLRRPPAGRKPAPVKPEVPASAKVEAKPEVPVKVEAPAAEPAEEVNVPDTHIRIEAEKCLFCGKCEHNCPANAISIDRRNRTWTIDREKCITCGVCADGCPAHCLTLADAWEAGEKKEMKAAFQGRVLRRPARPAPAKEAPKDGEPHA